MNSTLSFILGAVGGAIVGRYSEKLLELAERWLARLRVRTRAQRLHAEFRGGLFAVCGFHAPILVHGFDSRGIRREAIVSRLVRDAKPPLAEVDEGTRKLYVEAKRFWDERLREGTIFNGRKLALRYFHPSRGEHEEMAYRLDFAPTEYVVQRAWNTVYQQLGAAGRAPFIAEGGSRVSSLYSNTFGVSLAVISADGHLLLARRGLQTAVSTGMYTSGCAEGMDDRDLHADTGHPDPYLTAYRGLSEELGLRLDPATDAVKITCLVLRTDVYEWGMLGMADLRNLATESWTRAHIQELWSNAKGRDKYEIGGLEFVPFAPGPVAAFLGAHRHEIEPYALVATIYALLSCFPRRAVIAALEGAAGAHAGRAPA